MIKIGHRGVSSLKLENSLEGFKYAVQLGVKAIEMDVQVSADGVPVVFHDRLLDRVTDATGYLANYTFADLQKSVRLKNGEAIPTLDDVLLELVGNVEKIYVEVKSPHAVNIIQDVVAAHAPKGLVVMSSFHHKCLLEIKKKNKDQRVMALFACSPINPEALFSMIDIEEVGLGFESVDPDLLSFFKGKGIDVYAYTVNDQRDFELAKKYGLKGVFTDNPC